MSDGSNQKPQWQLVADAVVALGGKATHHQVWDYLKKGYPEIPLNTVAAELNSVSVNSPTRTSYHSGKEPRRTDTGNRYDRLFKVGYGRDAYYVTYDPTVHGVWEIYSDPAATSTHKTAIRPAGSIAFSAKAAMDYLDRRYPSTYSGTSHIAAYRTQSGRELAFDPGKDPLGKAVLQVFVEDRPPYLPDQAVTEYPPNRARNHHLASRAPGLASGNKAYSVRLSSLSELEELCAWYDTANQGTSEEHVWDRVTMIEPINKILFGPPGTGKTYRTVNEALRILDPAFLAMHSDSREALKKRFDELVDAGSIRFVTFHQSFSYEDFVEGIRANADSDDSDEKEGGIRYSVEPGVFKQICEAARSRTVAEAGSGIDIIGRRIWKVSLGDANTEGHIYDECMSKGLALLGFGLGVDLSGVTSRAAIVERIRAAGGHVESNDYSVTALDLFVRRMQIGDLVVVSQGNLKFRAIGEVTGEYVHVDRDGVDTYAQGRPVRWLRRYDPARPYTDLMENRFSQMTIYEPGKGTINLGRLADLLAPERTVAQEPEPRVLIIDEINRGNVSRIFGELITLIEPSRREGGAEALKVILPYSRDEFSVPRNLHIIGTMNTADRSLAGLDVALRRRFEFTEMLPDIEALRGIEVQGVPVDKLLSRMNQRIEVLLGRDYMLGHAYFMRLKETRTIELLAEIFHRQVLPLLQEYFFEDWQKIAWVLNDHQKQDEALKFLRQSTVGVTELFGDVELPGEGKLWSINPGAFANPNAYLAIITAPQSAKVPQAIA